MASYHVWIRVGQNAASTVIAAVSAEQARSVMAGIWNEPVENIGAHLEGGCLGCR